MKQRILISIGISIAFVLAAFAAFGLSAVFRGPSWLTVASYQAISWPLSFISHAFPNTTCIDGREICGHSGNAYLATAILLPAVYAFLAFALLSWRSSRIGSKHSGASK